jgi:TonB family protein
LPFQRFIQTNAPQLTSAAVIPAYARTPITLPPMPAPTQSSLTVTGELGTRKLLVNPALPLWPVAGTLRPTQVTVAVDASGDIFSAVVEKSSGDAAADEHALRAIQQLRFSPSAQRTPKSPIGSELTWGTVIWRWQTTPSSITKPALQ